MTRTRRGPGRNPGTRQTDRQDDRGQRTADSRSRVGTAATVCTRWLLGEAITDAELAAVVALLDRVERDLELVGVTP